MMYARTLSSTSLKNLKLPRGGTKESIWGCKGSVSTKVVMSLSKRNAAERSLPGTESRACPRNPLRCPRRGRSSSYFSSALGRSVVALHYPSNTIQRVCPAWFVRRELAQCRQLWSIGRGVGVPASWISTIACSFRRHRRVDFQVE